MFDPLTLFMVGAGALAYKEMQKKDYGVLTPARDERYRNAMASCYDPQALLAESKLFSEYGLKAQAALLKRRAEWRGRPDALKREHEAVYQKALKSTNIPAILQVAVAFEGWTATKKAGTLREHARLVQERMLQEVARNALELDEKLAAEQAEQARKEASTSEEKVEEKPSNGANGVTIPQNELETQTEVNDT